VTVITLHRKSKSNYLPCNMAASAAVATTPCWHPAPLSADPPSRGTGVVVAAG